MSHKVRPLLLVAWEDSCAEGGWAETEKFHTDCNATCVCYSVGWLYQEDEKAITLAANFSPEGHENHSTGNLQYILKRCIVEQAEFKLRP